ncbi:LURP-one-related family protein [Streptomyces sp. H10-C2]|uniref:LURP-one-related/scramblase family protein n=1 Tax=unclassified Streptomyces TaxID=2593676 RepID=UPI0024BAF479|nr:MULTISPECIES: LURP-one-related family protein [unclassified Streptomyces]MDJ0340303.1 LURP-one-related family protein [Streptomyces sp. PH10-H1]MDJ0368249.1 LURP-one-related family protein [Streptomyces sp. H10-C2]
MKYLVREKLFAIGDDYWIEDERGERAFYVDGKVLRIRDTLELRDARGAEVAVIRKKLVSLRDAMTVERGGDVLVTVRKKRLTLLRDVFRAELASGEELEVRGDIVDKEFDIEYEGERLARISRKWFRMRDTYSIDVEREDADAGMLIAIAVCVDRLVDKEHEREHGED